MSGDKAWYFFSAFFLITMFFYAIGRDDGEHNGEGGLMIWGLINIILFVWLLATAWATRGE